MSAFRELRCLARLVQTILLALFLSGIALEIACLFENGAIGFLVADAEGAGDAVTDRARLSGHAAAVHVDDDVELVGRGHSLKGLIDDKTHGVEGEVVLEGALVDGDVALAGHKTDTGDGGLSPAGAEILNFLFNGFLRSHLHTSPYFSSSATGHCA